MDADAEELLNRKIEKIRLKNEEMMKKHKMIEEDKQMAEQSGRSVTLQLNSSSKKLEIGEIPRRTVSCTEATKGYEDISPTKRSPDDKLLHHRQRNTQIHQQEAQPSGHKAVSPKAIDVFETPPPDPTYNFLADRMRDGNLPIDNSSSKNGSYRHRRNFGGNSFENAALKVQHNKEQRLTQTAPVTPHTKMEYQLMTTGKERLEYAKWKSEQEKIDRERVRRQVNEAGEWRREWDRNKVQFETEDNCLPTASQQAEPTRRPAGRIGSGRFSCGDGQGISQKGCHHC